MIDIKADTNLKNFVGAYNTWLRRVQPRERLCLNEKMAKRSRTALIRTTKKLGYRGAAKFIKTKGTTTKVEVTVGAGRTGRGRGVTFNRTAQLVQLAATGGRVDFRRNRSRLKGLWIVKDRRFTLSGALAKVQQVRDSGVRRISGSTTIWFGSGGLMLVTSPKGTTLFRRNKSRRDRAIIYLPAKANYKKKFDIEDTIALEINKFLEKDAKNCFDENTIKHFKQARRTRG